MTKIRLISRLKEKHQEEKFNISLHLFIINVISKLVLECYMLFPDKKFKKKVMLKNLE